MRTRTRLGALAAAAGAALAVGLPVASGIARTSGHGHEGREQARATHEGADHERDSRTRIKHVLLLSVDGLHQSDLSWYVQQHPDSALAKLTHRGIDYTQARTPIPSDSFPGMVGQVTGGDPRTTGIYYDAEYNHNLLPAGTTSCAGKPLGAEVNYFEIAAKNPLALDSGQGLSGLPSSILHLTGNPTTLLDPNALPVDPATCQPVYPHQYLKVNTIFEVARSHGLRTAWSDKHAAYEILNGPSGNGIQDLFTPEINADAQQANGQPAPGGGDYTVVNSRTMQYDSYKVQAIINEIDGYDHSRSQTVGTPAIFGMNFQTVSTAEKLPVSDGLNGGYLPGTTTPGPLLSRALGYINTNVGAMVSELHAQGLSRSTAIILSAKHGQSPIDPSTLFRTDDGAIIDGLNAAWKQAHPGAGNLTAGDPGDTAAGSRDDAFPLWLTDRSQAAANFAKAYLWHHDVVGNTYNPADPASAGPTKTLHHSGLKAIYAGAGAARYFGVSVNDPRHPDLWGVVQHGVVYTGKTKKIAEHGGADFEDRNVPILVYAPGAEHGPRTQNGLIETTSIAPSILSLLGLDPSALQAVRIEGTPTLPGLR